MITAILSKGILAAFVVSTAFVYSAKSVRGRNPSCAELGNGAGSMRFQTLKESLASTDSDAVLYRQGVGLLGVDSGSVFVVSDTIVCTAVTSAADAAFRSSIRNGPFAVVRAGPRYVAFEPEAEPQPVFYVDTNFVFVTWTR